MEYQFVSFLNKRLYKYLDCIIRGKNGPMVEVITYLLLQPLTPKISTSASFMGLAVYFLSRLSFLFILHVAITHEWENCLCKLSRPGVQNLFLITHHFWNFIPVWVIQFIFLWTDKMSLGSGNQAFISSLISLVQLALSM